MDHHTLIEEIFVSHHKYYCSLHSETIKQQAGQVCQVGADYQGRVLYELIQNAVDRAERHIKVVLDGKRLLVGNDGKRFTYRHEYDYQKGNVSRSDFQALCSISTSAKEMSTSIGNKGVGFKSTFSVSSTGYVNIHTSGEIIECDVPAPISFRLYDLFQNEEELVGLNVPKNVKDFIAQHIGALKKENHTWGIPGYYFPILLNPNDADDIATWFEKGFVTVIEIPVKDTVEIERLFDEIKSRHFRFIETKYKDKAFEIVFEQTGKDPVTMVAKGDGRLFSAPTTAEITHYAEAAGLRLGMSSVSVYFRNKEEIGISCGHLYNYLATDLYSPFWGVDFNADFYTTVDRKSINWSGKVGEYNKVLLEACYQLYFSLLMPEISFEHQYIKALNPKQVALNPMEFQWKWMEYKGGSDEESLKIIRDILQLNKGISYAAEVFCKIAAWYFSACQAEEKSSSDFFGIVKQIAWGVIHIYNCSYYSSHEFLKEVGNVLKRDLIPVLPDTDISGEILYRRKDDKGDVILPSMLGVKITSFDVGQDLICKGLGITKFNEYNEVYKYFKQCYNDGEVSNESISEDKQIELLSALCGLIRNTKEKERYSTDRMVHYYTQDLRDNNTVVNQAAFALSTLFFKTRDGKYKPAQLLRRKEIDPEFLRRINEDDDVIVLLLQMTGVSFQENFFYADCRIFTKLNNGIERIPLLIDIRFTRDNLLSKDVFTNIRVYRQRNENIEGIHPAIINSHYDFLESVPEDLVRSKELENLLVRKYDDFPEEYINILKEHIAGNLNQVSEIIRFYRKYASLFITKGFYLVMLNKRLQWIGGMDFNVVENSALFDLWTEKIPEKPLLCYTATTDSMPEILKAKLMKVSIGKCCFKTTHSNDDALKSIILEKMIYLLYIVSNSSSEINYLEDTSGLDELRDRVQSLCIRRGNGLSRKITLCEEEFNETINYAIEGFDLYLDVDCGYGVQAKAIAAYLFRNTSLADSFELVLFHESISSISEENMNRLRRSWKQDYEEQYAKFVNELNDAFPEFELTKDKKWYCFNKQHPSETLYLADELGKLDELKAHVIKLATNEPYNKYFPEFSLVIDDYYIQADADSLSKLLNRFYPEQEIELIQELSQKWGRLSNPKFVQDQMERLRCAYPDFNDKFSHVESPAIDYGKERKVEDIYQSFLRINPIPCDSLKLIENGTFENKPLEYNGRIYHGENAGKNNVEQCIETGMQGEELVLIELIRQFEKECIDKQSQIEAIRQIDEFVRKWTDTPISPVIVSGCYDAAGTPEIRRALISLCYYAWHHKYAPFDLVCYIGGMPKAIEVKSTSGSAKQFPISQKEVTLACQLGDNYELIRVINGRLLFLGNPFPQLKDKLTSIGGKRFNVHIRGFMFELKE